MRHDAEQKYGSPFPTRGLIAFGLFATCMTGIIAVLTLVIPNEKTNKAGIMAWVVMLGGGAITMVLTFGLYHFLWRLAQRRMVSPLSEEGFTINLKPTEEDQKSVLDTIERNLIVRSNAKRIVHWCAFRAFAPATARWPALAFQLTEMTGSGKTTQAAFRTVLAWPIERGKPEIWLRRWKQGLAVPQPADSAPALLTGDPVLDKRFLIQCPSDVSGPERLLNAAIRSFILAGPKKESWMFSGGYAICCYHGDVTPKGLSIMRDRAQAAAEMWDAL